MTMIRLIDPATLIGHAEAWAGLILPVAAKASLLLGLFGILSLFLRRASASTRHLLWTLGVAGVLLLPVLGTGLPSWGVLDLPLASQAQKSTEEAGVPAEVVPLQSGATRPVSTEPPAISSDVTAASVTPESGGHPESSSALSGLLSMPAMTWGETLEW